MVGIGATDSKTVSRSSPCKCVSSFLMEWFVLVMAEYLPKKIETGENLFRTYLGIYPVHLRHLGLGILVLYLKPSRQDIALGRFTYKCSQSTIAKRHDVTHLHNQRTITIRTPTNRDRQSYCICYSD